MKFGQMLSLMESAMPEELAAPYRATLTKLQDSAPPMPASTVDTILSAASSASAGGTGSRSSATCPRPRRRSARCTADG